MHSKILTKPNYSNQEFYTLFGYLSKDRIDYLLDLEENPVQDFNYNEQEFDDLRDELDDLKLSLDTVILDLIELQKDHESDLSTLEMINNLNIIITRIRTLT